MLHSMQDLDTRGVINPVRAQPQSRHFTSHPPINDIIGNRSYFDCLTRCINTGECHE